jgi:tRNA A37 threonylcarbamoyladenosine biosynthesis protein TsaE
LAIRGSTVVLEGEAGAGKSLLQSNARGQLS